MYKIFASISFLSILFIVSCGSNEPKVASSSESNPTATNSSSETSATDPSSYDPKRGEGKFNEQNVSLDASVDGGMAKKGEEIQGVKCASCHKLSDEKLVGPGWKGVTKRKSPFWIMNFITNPDPMIDKDPEVQAQLELCLVRMPNQNLSDEEARSILEFMRKNDQ
jgi:mono/diheme cytochrome c family protein